MSLMLSQGSPNDLDGFEDDKADDQAGDPVDEDAIGPVLPECLLDGDVLGRHSDILPFLHLEHFGEYSRLVPYKDPETRRQYQRKWCARNRAEFFAGKTCVRCGSDQDLELDHIDRKQKIDHVIWSWSKVRREAELAKCQVLCGPCHKQKTRADLNERIECANGHPWNHNKYGDCVDCKRERMRRYRASKRCGEVGISRAS